MVLDQLEERICGVWVEESNVSVNGLANRQWYSATAAPSLSTPSSSKESLYYAFEEFVGYPWITKSVVSAMEPRRYWYPVAQIVNDYFEQSFRF